MAVKVPRKTKKQRINRKTGFEDPVFEGCERWSGQKYHRYVDKYKYLYYTQSDTKTIAPSIWTWMAKNGYEKADISAAKKAKYIPPQVGILCRLMNLGMPTYHKKEAEYWESLAGTNGKMTAVDIYVNAKLETAIEEGYSVVKQSKAVADTKKQVHKPSIRDVMNEASIEMCKEIDEIVDAWIADKNHSIVKAFNPVNVLRKTNAKANHARIIRKFYEAEYEEMLKVNNIPTAAKLKKMSAAEQDEWEQIKEGYDHFDSKTKKAAVELFKKIVGACDIIIAEQAVNRKPRKVKEKSADQKVSKLKFKASDSDYGIASKPPTKLIGAVFAVVFNCKNRKLGIYVANNTDGFSVKGTTLQNFNESDSVQKTIRKPLEVLPPFKKITKAKAIKQFENLKTTDTKLNGRFNDETVILAVF